MNKKFTDIAKKSKVIVIKVGSNILVDDKHSLRKKWLGTLVSDVQKLRKIEVALTISCLCTSKFVEIP